MNDITAVIPVRNEEANLEVLVSRLTSVFEKMRLSHVIILVTDVNTDNTLGVLRKLHDKDDRIRVLKLSNAFGHHAAVYAGLAHAEGKSVVIMDGDLQDYPEDIPLLFNKMQEGFDVVYGIKERKNETLVRNLCSKAFVRVLQWLSDYRMDVNTSMFRIISRRVADAVLQFRERDPSLTFIMGLIGFPTSKVVVTSGVRFHGRTNYGLVRQVNLAISSIVSFSTKPLRLISYFGFAVSAASTLYFVEVLFERIVLGRGVLGWPTIVVLLCFFNGSVLLALGVIGEYVARTYMESKRRPLYIIEERIGIPEEEE